MRNWILGTFIVNVVVILAATMAAAPADAETTDGGVRVVVEYYTWTPATVNVQGEGVLTPATVCEAGYCPTCKKHTFFPEHKHGFGGDPAGWTNEQNHPNGVWLPGDCWVDHQSCDDPL